MAWSLLLIKLEQQHQYWNQCIQDGDDRNKATQKMSLMLLNQPSHELIIPDNGSIMIRYE